MNGERGRSAACLGMNFGGTVPVPDHVCCVPVCCVRRTPDSSPAPSAPGELKRRKRHPEGMPESASTNELGDCIFRRNLRGYGGKGTGANREFRGDVGSIRLGQ